MYKFIISISSSHQLKALIAALYLLCSPVPSWTDHLLKRQTGKHWTYVVESGFHTNVGDWLLSLLFFNKPCISNWKFRRFP